VFMKQSGESLREARLQKSRIFNAKSSTKIGTWNVRTLFQCSETVQDRTKVTVNE